MSISHGKTYGTGFYRNLSQDLKAAIPEAEGFSRQNLQYMKKMYLLYSKDSANCQQVVGNYETEICQQAVGDFIFSVPWGHHRTQIDKYSIGVAEFQLTKFIPDEFKSSLPSIEDIELELK